MCMSCLRGFLTTMGKTKQKGKGKGKRQERGRSQASLIVCLSGAEV